MLAATLRLARDLGIAEEATADAFLLALQTWPNTGIPESVEAWLLTVARRTAVDRIRRAAALRERLTALAASRCRMTHRVDDRMPAVRRAVQLAYALGHTAASGTALRDDELASRALYLAHSLCRARPKDRESAGLLGVLLLSRARHGSRVGAGGMQILLEHADRRAWDHLMIAEGLRCMTFAAGGSVIGPFALQAAIAAEQSRPTIFESTDWSRIVDLMADFSYWSPAQHLPSAARWRCPMPAAPMLAWPTSTR